MNLNCILDLNQQEALGGKNQNMDSLNDYLVEKRKLMNCKLGMGYIYRFKPNH